MHRLRRGLPCHAACTWLPSSYLSLMNIKVIVHEADEGGFWAEVPALPGCASQGETMDDLIANVREAINGWLEADVSIPAPGSRERVLDLAF